MILNYDTRDEISESHTHDFQGILYYILRKMKVKKIKNILK